MLRLSSHLTFTPRYYIFDGHALKCDSKYNCGEDSRSRKAWVKIKPDYVDAAGDPLDLLILGGYYGDGRRRGNVSHFLMGVAARNGMTADNHEFVALCKVGSGYNDQALAQLQQQERPR